MNLTQKQKAVYDEFAKYESGKRPKDIAVSLGYNGSESITYEIKVLVDKELMVSANEGSVTKYKAIK